MNPITLLDQPEVLDRFNQYQRALAGDDGDGAHQVTAAILTLTHQLRYGQVNVDDGKP